MSRRALHSFTASLRSALHAVVVVAAMLALGACAVGSAPGDGAADEDAGSADADATVDTPTIPGDDADAGDDTGRRDTDAAADADDAAGRGVGEPCVDDAECADFLCLRFEAGSDSGVCSTFCSRDSDCAERADCILVENSGGDARRVCIPDDLCVDVDEDEFGFGPGCRGPDCDDGDDRVRAGADERCDGIDNDCDGEVDENPVDVGGACSTGFDGACSAGIARCDGGLLTCEASATPTEERCDGVDNDCDGEIDEGIADAPLWYADADGDRFGTDDGSVASCTPIEGRVDVGGDCDDTRRTVNPAAAEVCDGLDNDCDGEIDEGRTRSVFYRDADRDGAGSEDETVEACVQPAGYVPTAGDCDDTRADVGPAATEICDGVDNDCDGEVDEDGGETVFYRDADEDGAGDPDEETTACTAPDGFVTNAEDCDDGDAEIGPDAAELCDGVDNDCDGEIDEDGASTYYADADGDGVGVEGDTIESCGAPDGYAATFGDCDDRDPASYPGADEVCDGADNDCDGAIDEEGVRTWYRDADADGLGTLRDTVEACARPDGYVSGSGDCDDTDGEIYSGAPETCDGKDNDCDGAVDEVGVRTWYRDADGDDAGTPLDTVDACAAPAGYVSGTGDCNDRDAEVFPGAREVCDGKDNDCDDRVDEDGVRTWYRDADGDGSGTPLDTVESCAAPDGYVAGGGDCNDRDAEVYAGAVEACDGKDNDCDDRVDEDGVRTWYRDADADGAGTVADTVEACSAPPGYVAASGDCDDGDGTRHPGATESCNGEDDDCDGATDEGLGGTWYPDADGDGFGRDAPVSACTAPDRHVASAGDCDDTNASVNPDAEEVCDDVDNDCDGEVDGPDSEDATLYFRDDDGDGWGFFVPFFVPGVRACERPDGYATNFFDCDDGEERANPGETEVCDGIDNDCDDETDEGLAETWYRDADGDGYGDAATTREACAKPDGWVSRLGDCDDGRTRVNPDEAERCGNGRDDDCDEAIDEGCAPRCDVTRSSAGLDSSLPASITTIFEDAGLAVTPYISLSSTRLEASDVVAFSGSYLSVDSATLASWLEAGGTAIIFASNVRTVCERINADHLAEVGLSFDCDAGVVGPVESVESHPIMSGVGPSDLRFSSGIGVRDDGAGGAALASIDGVVVGRAVDVGCGRLILWGDTGLMDDEAMPGASRFWLNVVDWLTSGP